MPGMQISVIIKRQEVFNNDLKKEKHKKRYTKNVRHILEMSIQLNLIYILIKDFEIYENMFCTLIGTVNLVDFSRARVEKKFLTLPLPLKL